MSEPVQVIRKARLAEDDGRLCARKLCGERARLSYTIHAEPYDLAVAFCGKHRPALLNTE